MENFSEYIEIIDQYLPIANNLFLVFFLSSIPQLRTHKAILRIPHILVIVTLFALFSYHLYTALDDRNIAIASILFTTVFFLTIFDRPIIKDMDQLQVPHRIYRYKRTKLLVSLILAAIVLRKTKNMRLLVPIALCYILLIISFFTYKSCRYDLPLSWNKL
jgi:hypothetical protein